MPNIFSRGFLKVFSIQGIPIRVHWTVPLVCLMFGGARFAPGLWLGILLVILLHELGHAWFVRRFGMENLGIDLTGIGGLCRWRGSPTQIERAWVAWGGVLAQTALFVVTYSIIALTGYPPQTFLADLVGAFLFPNLFIAAFNLIPFKPLDGGEAWPLIPLLYRRFKRGRKWKQKLVKPEDIDNPLSQTLHEALKEAERRDLN